MQKRPSVTKSNVSWPVFRPRALYCFT